MMLCCTILPILLVYVVFSYRFVLFYRLRHVVMLFILACPFNGNQCGVVRWTLWYMSRFRGSNFSVSQRTVPSQGLDPRPFPKIVGLDRVDISRAPPLTLLEWIAPKRGCTNCAITHVICLVICFKEKKGKHVQLIQQ